MVQNIDWDALKQPFQEFGADIGKAMERAPEEFGHAFAEIGDIFSNTAQWLDDRQAELHQYMSDSWEGIKQSVGGYLAELEESAGTTWEEISSGASSMESNIASAFQLAKDEAEAAWDGATGWFEENVWGPLSERAQSAWSSLQSTIANIQSSASSFSFSIPSIFSGHATGSSFYAGGWTEINERGGEIVDLPQGSRIYPHATTERMIQAELENRQSSSSGPVVIKGNTFYVREEADIDRIAYKLAKLISQGHINYGGGY